MNTSVLLTFFPENLPQKHFSFFFMTANLSSLINQEAEEKWLPSLSRLLECKVNSSNIFLHIQAKADPKARSFGN